METKFCITKVVRADELELHTQDGWVLIQPVLAAEVRQMNHQALPSVCHVGNNGYNYNTPSPVSLQHDQVVQIHAFLIGLDEESSVAKLSEQLKAVQQNERVAEQKQRDANQAANDLTEKLDRLQKQYNTAQESSAEMRMRADKLGNELSERRSELSKIKAAIGTKTYDECLA